MLRHGLVPPKEVVRPESALAAMQGIQPKGLGDDGEGTLPVAKVIQSLFPFYTRFTRLGGAPRQQPLEADALTVRDLELACHEARAHTGDVYDGVYREYTALLDHNRSLQPAWVEDARDALHRQQRRLLDDLDEKFRQAPELASDEFMYQGQAEVQQEVSAARALLDDIPPPWMPAASPTAPGTACPTPLSRRRRRLNPRPTAALPMAAVGHWGERPSVPKIFPDVHPERFLAGSTDGQPVSAPSTTYQEIAP